MGAGAGGVVAAAGTRAGACVIVWHHAQAITADKVGKIRSKQDQQIGKMQFSFPTCTYFVIAHPLLWATWATYGRHDCNGGQGQQWSKHQRH